MRHNATLTHALHVQAAAGAEFSLQIYKDEYADDVIMDFCARIQGRRRLQYETFFPSSRRRQFYAKSSQDTEPGLLGNRARKYAVRPILLGESCLLTN